MYSQVKNQQNNCLKCHQGIETINEKMNFLDCEDCHKSKTNSSAKETDNAKIYNNPGDFNIVENTCGKCHSEAKVAVPLTHHIPQVFHHPHH